jgi:hypothetical protein
MARPLSRYQVAVVNRRLLLAAKIFVTGND